MSRSGYSEDLDDWALIRWRGQVASAIRGKRGQSFLRDLIAALDAMPVKELVQSELETLDGEVCTLGALGRARGLDMSQIDPEDPPQVAAAFNIADQLAQEIVYMNDEYFGDEWDAEQKRIVALDPEKRWEKMRQWVAAQLRTDAAR